MIYGLGSGTQKPYILVYIFRNYDMCCQTCINLNLDIETVYKFLNLNVDMYHGVGAMKLSPTCSL